MSPVWDHLGPCRNVPRLYQAAASGFFRHVSVQVSGNGGNLVGTKPQVGKLRVGSGGGLGGPAGGSGGPGGAFVIVVKVMGPLRRNQRQDHQNHHQDHQNQYQNALGVYLLGV